MLEALALPAQALANGGYGDNASPVVVVIGIALVAAIVFGTRYVLSRRRRSAADKPPPYAPTFGERTANRTARLKVNVRRTPVAFNPAGVEPDVADELSKFADLRDRGVLSDAEFKVQKAKLLGDG